jgi:hypothetical protein
MIMKGIANPAVPFSLLQININGPFEVQAGEVMDKPSYAQVSAASYAGHPPCNIPQELGIVTHVSAGGRHTCVVDSAGKLHRFGDKDHGQCDVPDGLGVVTQVSAGLPHTCVVATMGKLFRCGANGHGQCEVPEPMNIVMHITERSPGNPGLPYGSFLGSLELPQTSFRKALPKVTAIKVWWPRSSGNSFSMVVQCFGMVFRGIGDVA